MVMLHDQVVFLNFDGSYEHQKELTASIHHQWIDFSNLRETSLYCSPRAFRIICDRLALIPDKGLAFLGSGNYHYAALALMREIVHPFTLVLFDHHTDLSKGQIGPLLSCSSWVYHALAAVPRLKKVIIIGPDPLSVRSASSMIRRKVIVFPENRIPPGERIASVIPTKAIQISIDKDILSPRFVKTNWDQGKLSIGQLCQSIKELLSIKEVEEIDVCGEWPIKPHEHLNRTTLRRLQINEQCNLDIARIFLQSLNSHPQNRTEALRTHSDG
ncbi:arginase [Sporolactobacillus sp. CQH2019]|uniref:arginase n=1 Tax=Sporolactobacillus sp. CQH2019 TaxID=3023512 RepID=UPI002367FF2D|nr:arginase [Sporolactobacillus sp. CQH2019]MDD9150368.1 arginase [Sporolactobacillus sp. CQH2019]